MKACGFLVVLAMGGCSFLGAASGDFKPPHCGRPAPLIDGIVSTLALGGCIVIAATDDGRAVIPRSVLCVPLGAIALTTAISGLYGLSKRDACRR